MCQLAHCFPSLIIPRRYAFLPCAVRVLLDVPSTLQLGWSLRLPRELSQPVSAPEVKVLHLFFRASKEWTSVVHFSFSVAHLILSSTSCAFIAWIRVRSRCISSSFHCRRCDGRMPVSYSQLTEAFDDVRSRSLHRSCVAAGTTILPCWRDVGAQVVSQQVAPPQHAPPRTGQGSGSPLPFSRVFVLI